MGGRGKSSDETGAAGAVPPMVGKGNVTNLEDFVRQLGFANVEDARKAADVRNFMADHLKEAGVDPTTPEGQKLLNDLLGTKIPVKQLREMIKKNSKLAPAVAAHYIAHHYSGGHGHGTLGPIMLRIGLPRDKLLDIFNAFKPLKDHAILNLEGPFQLPGWQDPFVAAHAAQTGQVPPAQMGPILDWLSQYKVRSYVTDIWLKKITLVPTSISQLLGN